MKLILTFKHPRKPAKTRQAMSIAKIRKERAKAGMCWHCGGRVAVRLMRDGSKKKLKTCEAFLVQIAVNKKKKG